MMLSLSSKIIGPLKSWEGFLLPIATFLAWIGLSHRLQDWGSVLSQHLEISVELPGTWLQVVPALLCSPLDKFGICSCYPVFVSIVTKICDIKVPVSLPVCYRRPPSTCSQLKGPCHTAQQLKWATCESMHVFASLFLWQRYIGEHSGHRFASPEPWAPAISIGMPYTLRLERLFWLRWSDSSAEDRSLSTGSSTSGLFNSGLKISTVNLWVYWIYSSHKGKAALQNCSVDNQGSLCFIYPQEMSTFSESGWSGHITLE